VPITDAKRESRRLVGDHILTQNDVQKPTDFADRISYGGWPIDVHHPKGIYSGDEGSFDCNAPVPIYTIPYRSLYSANVDNLLFAGRCMSVTHIALGTVRVQGTLAAMGQAAGTAAALAARKGIAPRDVNAHIPELQQTLLRDDAYLPWVPQQFSPLTREATLAASQGDPEPVRDGVNRPVGDALHRWACDAGDWLAYEFDSPQPIQAVSLVLDSALHKNIQMSHHQKDDQLVHLPEELPRAFRIEGRTDGAWLPIATVADNRDRLVRMPVEGAFDAVRFTLDTTWGGEPSSVYAFYVD